VYGGIGMIPVRRLVLRLLPVGLNMGRTSTHQFSRIGKGFIAVDAGCAFFDLYEYDITYREKVGPEEKGARVFGRIQAGVESRWKAAGFGVSGEWFLMDGIGDATVGRLLPAHFPILSQFGVGVFLTFRHGSDAP
jgi:hypothetical protein